MINKYVNSKKIRICVVVGIVIVIVICLLLFVKKKSNIEYIKDTIHVEYGDKIPENINDYIGDTTNKIREDLIISAKVDLLGNADVPEIGEYKVAIKYKSQVKNVFVEVSDTVKPVFEGNFSEIETYKGVEVDIDKIKVSDLSDVSVSIDMKNVDINKAGEYKTKIIAIDGSGNENTIDTIIVVKENEISLSKDKVTLQKGDSEKITASVKGDSSDVKYKSSNSGSSNTGGSTSKPSTGNSGSSSSNDSDSSSNSNNSSNSSNSGSSNTGGSTSKPSTGNGGSSSSNGSDSSSNSNNSSNSSSSKPTSLNASTISYLKASKSSDNILVVSSTKKSNRSVTISYYQKVSSGWKQTFKVSGIVGKEGIGKGKEGDKRTPTGIYSITKLFGIDDNPGTQLSYHKLTGSEYWCGGPLYNQWVDENTMDHKQCDKINDEHLIDYPINYDYCAALSYNSNNTPGKGSAIFVHCKKGSYTAGCVAMPKDNMRTFMQGINSSTKVIIDLESNIFDKY